MNEEQAKYGSNRHVLEFGVEEIKKHIDNPPSLSAAPDAIKDMFKSKEEFCM